MYLVGSVVVLYCGMYYEEWESGSIQLGRGLEYTAKSCDDSEKGNNWSLVLSASLHITQRGESALMLAAWEGMTEVVSLLLEAGANIDLQDEVK